MAASGVDGATALLQQLKTGADAADDKDANPERRRKAAFKAYEVGSIRLIANGHICAQAYARTHAHTLTHTRSRTHADADIQEREIPRMREENPGLKLSQIKERIFQAWQKSPENPMNQE